MKVLIINQAFYPDVVATAQKSADLALRLVEAGHEVTVLASSRAYDQPERRFAARQDWRGVQIVRTAGTGLGKSAKWRRMVDFGSFWLSCLAELAMLPAHDVVVAMTSPPLIALPAALFVRWKGGRLVSWIMDLNPDEAVAAGWLRAGSATHRALSACLDYSLHGSSRVIVLDRFMAERVREKGVETGRIEVLPPWAHNRSVQFDEAGRAAFRRKHGLEDRFVVMYAGNHSPCHPLDSVLAAAQRLRHDARVKFCFIGGGGQFGKVKAFAADHGLDNVLCLPYQPFDELAAALSAADLHLAVMGEPYVGIVHPCKVYDILTIGAPCLFVGPVESHVGDLARLASHLYTASHGEVDLILEHVSRAVRTPGRAPSHQQLAGRYSQDVLVPKMVESLEAVARS